MIQLKILMHVIPEKHKEVVQTLLSMTGSMEKEKGCLSFRLFQDIERCDMLCVLEEWVNREYLEGHFRSDIFGVMLGIRSLLHSSHTLHVQTIDRSEGMEAVHAIRLQLHQPLHASCFKEI